MPTARARYFQGLTALTADLNDMALSMALKAANVAPSDVHATAEGLRHISGRMIDLVCELEEAEAALDRAEPPAAGEPHRTAGWLSCI